ncbi:MAG TPA: ribosome biogenesis factor YjgA [Steroidobacteraceae bacterium]|nr:ribosome biogenesis factor YjgA [Steroidobacteraceae bacterium]
MRRRQLPGEPPPPTKTGLKRQAHAVQELADRLIDAPEALVQVLVLPEKLTDALALARRITRHGAKLRQRLFIAKLLRGVDPEPIRAALDATAQAARAEAARFRRAERWRDGLVERGPEAMAEFLAEFPHADRERLATLVAAARAERDGGHAGGRRRELFRFVQQQV